MLRILGIVLLSLCVALGAKIAFGFLEVSVNAPLALHEVRNQCKPFRNDFGDKIVSNVPGSALSGEAYFTEYFVWRRYVRMGCFTAKIELVDELHFKPAQLSYWP